MIDADIAGTIRLEEGDVLVVSAPKSSNMSSHMWEKYSGDIREVLSLLFMSNRIIVVPNDIKFTVVKKHEQMEIEE
jgi:hypothetical protein